MEGEPVMDPFLSGFFPDDFQAYLVPSMPQFIPGSQNPLSPPTQVPVSRYDLDSDLNSHSFGGSESLPGLDADEANRTRLRPSSPSESRILDPSSVSASLHNPLTISNHISPYSALAAGNQQETLPSFAAFTEDLSRTQTWGVGAHARGGTPVLNSDDYLSALVNGDFSSPSSYPTLPNTSTSCPSYQAHTQHAAALQVPVNQHTRHNLHLSHFLNSSPTTSSTPQTSPATTNTRAVDQAAANTTRREQLDALFNPLEDEPEVEILMAPVTRKRGAHSAGLQTTTGAATPTTKRQRTSLESSKDQSTNTTRTKPSSAATLDDPFAEDDEAEEEQEIKGLDVIDLATKDDIPEELKAPKVDKRIKLGAFQCAICMDDVSSLTVTHCGHLFCFECLHSALNIDATKNKCPICRQKIDMKDRDAYNTKTKGFWPLELKLMTATKKGKRVSR